MGSKYDIQINSCELRVLNVQNAEVEIEASVKPLKTLMMTK